MAGSPHDIADVPEPAVSNRSKEALFDHLVGAAEQREWHDEAERLPSLGCHRGMKIAEWERQHRIADVANMIAPRRPRRRSP